MSRQFGLSEIEDYKKRLQLLRAMFGETQEAFAARLGIPFKRWNQYERGYPLPRETAFIIRQKIATGIIEWIWFGDESQLSPNFRGRLRDAEASERERAAAKIKTKAKALLDRQQAAATALRKVKRRNKNGVPKR